MEAGWRPLEANTECSACGAAPLKRRDVIEHEECGCIRPREDFRTHDACPDCGSEYGEAAAFAFVGTIYTCRRCGERFDGGALGIGESDDGSGSTAERPPGSNGSERTVSFSAASAVSIRQKVAVSILLISIITVGVGSAVFPPPAWTRDVPAGETTWNSYVSIVVFRNDDVQPHYRTRAMKAVDRVFVEEEVPVTLGVIPVVGGRPITDDEDFCSYLRRQTRRHPDLFEVALHGYTHRRRTDFYGGSEFGGVDGDQREWISKGKQILTDCAGSTPRTFIPPMDTYDNDTVSALAAEGFQAVSGGGWFTRAYYGRAGVFVRGGLYHVPDSYSFVRNWSSNEFYSPATLERAFDRAYRNGSIYVQMLHYPTFTSQRKLDRLRALIRYMKSKPGVTFMTFDELTEGLAEGTVRRTEDGWIVRESARDEPGTNGPVERALETLLSERLLVGGKRRYA